MKNTMKPIFRANMFALIVVAVQFIGSVIFGHTPIRNMGTAELLVLSQALFILLPAALYFIITKKPVKKTLRLNAIGFREIIDMIIIAVLCYPIAALCGNISGIFFENNVQQVVESMDNMPYLGLIGVMALTPAICEEIMMRGVVLSGYEGKSIFKSAIMNGLIFGLIHLSGQQFLYAAVLGFLFAYIVRITDSIFSTMIVHFTFNGFNMTLSYLLSGAANGNVSEEAAASAAEGGFISAMIMLLVMSAVSIFLIAMILRGIKKRKKKTEALSAVPVYEDVMPFEGADGNGVEYGEAVMENSSQNEAMINLPFILLLIFNIVYIKIFG